MSPERKNMSEPTVEIERKTTEVVSRFVPETALHRAFTYHTQGLEGSSSLWDEMLSEIKPDDLNRHITGFVFNDQTVVWSDDAPHHANLYEAMGRDFSDVVIHIQSKYEPKHTRPQLLLGTMGKDERLIAETTDRFEQYLKRSNLRESTADVSVAAFDGYSASMPRKLLVS